MSITAQRQAKASIVMSPPPVGELVGMFVKRNPGSPRNLAETAGRVAAAFGGAAVKLTLEQQRQIVARQHEMPRLIAAILAKWEVPASAQTAEEDQGEGMGELISLTEGRQRLKSYTNPTPIEAWAGAVAGPGELESAHAIPRSTLHSWHKQHAVIGLLKGTRKHVFPLAQFIDGRPAEGLSQVVEAAGSPRTAWSWLIEAHPSLNARTPLAHLKAGKTLEVIDLANRDFGQS